MNKVALSLLVVAASGAYVWDVSQQQQTADPLGAMLSDSASGASLGGADATAGSGGTRVLADTPVATDCAAKAPEAAPATSPPLVVPRAVVAQTAMTTVATKGMRDGTYTGPATDAYYGPMQIEAVVQGGRLVTLRALQYPSDRRTSLIINRQALPMLRDEAIAAQSAAVDIITGATLTSEAFIRSLGGALAKAGL